MKTSIARGLTGAGIIGGTCAAALSLIGWLGIVASSGHICPASVGAVRCRDAASHSAMLAVYGLTAAGAAGLLVAAGRVVDPEA